MPGLISLPDSVASTRPPTPPPTAAATVYLDDVLVTEPQPITGLDEVIMLALRVAEEIIVVKEEMAAMRRERDQAQQRLIRARQEVECAVCFMICQDPLILACSHVFCRRCVHRWWDTERAPPLFRLATCPTCRHPAPSYTHSATVARIATALSAD